MAIPRLAYYIFACALLRGLGYAILVY